MSLLPIKCLIHVVHTVRKRFEHAIVSTQDALSMLFLTTTYLVNAFFYSTFSICCFSRLNTLFLALETSKTCCFSVQNPFSLAICLQCMLFSAKRSLHTVSYRNSSLFLDRKQSICGVWSRNRPMSHAHLLRERPMQTYNVCLSSNQQRCCSRYSW